MDFRRAPACSACCIVARDAGKLHQVAQGVDVLRLDVQARFAQAIACSTSLSL